jgi:hypothetical protein
MKQIKRIVKTTLLTGLFTMWMPIIGVYASEEEAAGDGPFTIDGVVKRETVKHNGGLYGKGTSCSPSVVSSSAPTNGRS